MLFEMKPELTEEQLEIIRQKKAYWAEIVQQWDQLTAYAPVPMFTKKHAERMIIKLECEV